MTATAIAYDTAVQDVLAKGGEKVTLPAAKPNPGRKVAGGEKLPHPAHAKEGAVRGVTGKPSRKAKGEKKAAPAKKVWSTGTGGPHPRLTDVWMGKDKKDCQIGERVKTATGTVGIVRGRWTKVPKDGAPVPMIHIRELKVPAAAADAVQTKDGKPRDKMNVPAKECTHTK